MDLGRIIKIIIWEPEEIPEEEPIPIEIPEEEPAIIEEEKNG
jgi:hypothetical protein